MQISRHRELLPALFLHIRKTGGTSIVWEAIRHYGHENVASHGDYIGKSHEQFKSIPFVSGHFGYDYAAHLAEGRFTFTFLRNPLERIISLYYFCRSRDPGEYPIYNLTRRYTFEEFLRNAMSEDLIYSYIFNSQVWTIASGPGTSEINLKTVNGADLLDKAKVNLSTFNYVGLYETFEQDARFIFDSLHFQECGSIPITNVTSNKVGIAELPRSVIDLLEKLTEWDSMLYQYVLSERARTRL